MFRALIHFDGEAGGPRTATVNILGPVNAGVDNALMKAINEPYRGPVVERTWSERLPAGVKRLPQVGEVWSTPSGSLAAVVSQATILDGGYNCVVLTKGSTTAMPGRAYVVDLDGNWLGSKEPVGDRHPLALARFVRRFDEPDHGPAAA